MILLIPVSLDSKQIRKQLSMISHTLSLVSMAPSGDSTSVRKTCRKYAEQTYKFQYINDSYLLDVTPLLFWAVTQPWMVEGYQRCGTAYQSHLQGSWGPRRNF